MSNWGIIVPKDCSYCGKPIEGWMGRPNAKVAYHPHCKKLALKEKKCSAKI